MAGGHDDDDPGFWPGYVAATAGLVQGMLIMAMALGISIFALGELASGGNKPQSTKPLGPGGPLDAAAPLPALAPLPVQPLRPLAELVPIPSAALRPVRVGFEGDATVTPASTASVIGEAVQNRRSLGVNRWRIRGTGDLQDPRQNRATYLRIMGVRAVMINLGVPADSIEMKMENVAIGSDGIVVIEPMAASGAPSGLAPQGGGQ